MLAETDGALLGYAAISPVTVSDGSDGWYGLGPVAVAPSHQRHGIGSRLVERALAELRRRGACGCVVLGDPAYYGRFGFRARPDLILAGLPPEYFQALAFGQARARGEVSFHDAFGAGG